MSDFCDCEDWECIKKNHNELFIKDDSYGWVLSWIEVTKEKGFSRMHKYGMKINFCPMCGKKLT